MTTTSGINPKQGTILQNRLDSTLIEGINLRLAMTGCPTFGDGSMSRFPKLAGPMFSRQQETMRLLADYLCPADWRIDHFLREYLYDTGVAVRWPARTFVLDSPGLARELSLPPDRDEFFSNIVRSYRVRQGVLHNPVNDRRTTQGVFHVAEGGLPVPDDKLAVPKEVFATAAGRGPASPRGIAAAAVHLHAGGPGGVFRFPVAPAGGLSRRPRIHRGEIHGNPLLRAGQPGQQPGFYRNDFRQRGRSLPPGK